MAENSTTSLVLQAIKAFWRSEGFSPSIRDIMDATGISSTSVVSYHIIKLERAGVMKRTPGVARSYVPIENGGKLMPKLYDAILKEFQKELEQYSAEIFPYPLPFTQVNCLAFLAATVATRCVAEKDDEAFCSCEVFKYKASVTEAVCRYCGKPPAPQRRFVFRGEHDDPCNLRRDRIPSEEMNTEIEQIPSPAVVAACEDAGICWRCGKPQS